MDGKEAVRWYRKATAHGYAPAEYKLGLLYYQGEAVAQDVGEALRWFHKAAEHGSAAAENEIGNAYEHGQGVRQDFDEAERWYRIAAEHVEVMRTVRAGSTPRIAAAREQGSFTTEGPANVVPGEILSTERVLGAENQGRPFRCYSHSLRKDGGKLTLVPDSGSGVTRL